METNIFFSIEDWSVYADGESKIIRKRLWAQEEKSKTIKIINGIKSKSIPVLSVRCQFSFYSLDVKLVWTDTGNQSGNRTTSSVIMRAVTSCQGKLT